MIARMMLEPADVLLLDEPTNDLDIPTLEVLEESLADFPGALVLVTHDRFLLDRVSTAVLALDGTGRQNCLPTTINGSKHSKAPSRLPNLKRCRPRASEPVDGSLRSDCLTSIGWNGTVWSS